MAYQVIELVIFSKMEQNAHLVLQLQPFILCTANIHLLLL